MQCTTMSAGAKTARIIARKATGIPASLYTHFLTELVAIRYFVYFFFSTTGCSIVFQKKKQNNPQAQVEKKK